MSLRKFGPNDIILNTMRTYPPVEFFVYNGKTYYNGNPFQSGAFSENIMGINTSSVSLYEYNIDRTGKTGKNTIIYPFITKDSARSSFKTVQAFPGSNITSYTNEFQLADKLEGTYPLSASIAREYIIQPLATLPSSGSTPTGGRVAVEGEFNRHYLSLRNKLDYYSRYCADYAVSSSGQWNKDKQTLNLISIPSIIYGSRIRPGTVSLKWYVTGALVGELRDTYGNGQLIEVSGTNPGSVAGVALYNEGFFLLTGSWALSTGVMVTRDTGGADNARWIYFGAGANDGLDGTIAGATFASASFGINFEGMTEIQTYTFFAKARKGEANYSNNPTFIEHGQNKVNFTSSMIYEENTNLRIKNIQSSSYLDYTPPFKRQVYISRVALYDDNKNLIGIASLANPVLKSEDEDYTFKIKLDI
jgi:hypothetical protein